MEAQGPTLDPAQWFLRSGYIGASMLQWDGSTKLHHRGPVNGEDSHRFYN